MFATFTIMSDKSLTLWWFCRIYLYTFISLYIYVVLSLFISVIMDAYDTIKKYYAEGFPETDLKKFIGPMNEDDLYSGVFRDITDPHEESLVDVIREICSLSCLIRSTRQNASTVSYSTLTPKTNDNEGPNE